jgi:hypothetical protein
MSKKSYEQIVKESQERLEKSKEVISIYDALLVRLGLAIKKKPNKYLSFEFHDRLRDEKE